MVSAAPFRDRVVHHAFCAIAEPLFERGFIHDSYANRTGKGTHRAIARYESFQYRFGHVLRCDLYRYFPAIDHTIFSSATFAGASGAGRPWPSLTRAVSTVLPIGAVGKGRTTQKPQ